MALEGITPGDLVVCYGWNAVARLQFTGRNLGRLLGSLPTCGAVQGIKQGLGDPVPLLAGTSKANHALIVGTPLARETDEGRLVHVTTIKYGERMLQSKLNERCVLTFKKAGVADRVTDITALINGQGGMGSVTTNDAGDYKFVITKATGPRTEGTVQISFKNPRVDHPPLFCHSTSEGCVWTEAEPYLRSHGGSFRVFRLRADDGGAALATAAAAVASKWAATKALERNARGEQYGHWKAFKSAFGSHIFGPSARKRAADYRKHRNRVGGPPSNNFFSGGENTYKDWFCSMFVIACYHAATDGDAQASKFLPLDARHTSPMTLDGYLTTSAKWQEIAWRHT